ncbi:efflux RND transporter periplasmic adaptor subunit [Legionella sp. W05-934-2]|jgi:cobalt-zinc-cadmium efflux system membrane fusion protein|uniref:efflux RND transporter periplasmic adaptor subunit n=1 Tax=Legionella sp. W05-934-2 TaxID=1198649 RepID=UPI0034636299
MRYGLLIFLLIQNVFASDFNQPEENRAVAVSNEAVDHNQIHVAIAGPQTILITLEVVGKIVPNANKTLYIYPRYDGIIQKLTKQLGDKVEQGDILATIESDHTLQTYSITAPFSGYIVNKTANPGEHVTNSSAIYRLADLSKVWVDLFIYRKQARAIYTGQSVTIYHDQHNGLGQTTTINYVSPLGVEHTQTVLARAELDNRNNRLTWLPGLYVDAHITIKEQKVPIAVLNEAIHTIEQTPVVFVRTDKGFKASPVKLGIRGDKYTQIESGLKQGQYYATKQSFLLKAELEKDQAAHSH